ncbi:long-chain fatty acid--CoA ligase [Streptomyces sp. WAC 06738]|uniref:AMP-dependent synthetase/ligase n=1 Tax=Streptomyces sp. WAC 06738 TaxID=2203210 RepID=UPI000F6D4BF2|nr:AMP-dependent synthetase/ligase [Streptomyces sp. WAC 06738]AZM48022.1 long-chain fatty acid--CoA ligase [Streptomyces sp. WAC 06738]
MTHSAPPQKQHPAPASPSQYLKEINSRLLPGTAVPPLLPPAVRADAYGVREAEVPPAAPHVQHGSLADIPFDNAAHAPGEPALARPRTDGTWADVTAAEFAEHVLAVAKGLIVHGLRPGDRLAIMSRTTYEWTLLDFAAWAAGLITVPVYPTSSAIQARHILHDSGALACAVESVEQARLISGRRQDLPHLAHLWQLDTGILGQLAAAGRDVPDTLVRQRRAGLGPASVATVIYTSGTTGLPKGCVLTHGNFLAEVDNAIELLYPLFTAVSEDPPATLLFLPLSHVLGRMTAIGCLRARVKLGHAPSIKTEDLLRDLAAFRPTFFVGIPYVLEKVFNTGRATAEGIGRAASFDRAAKVAVRYAEALEAELHGEGPGPGARLRALRKLYDALVYRRIRAALGGRVKYAICGGSPLGRRLAAFYAGADVMVFEGYGLTETTAAATVTPPLKPRFGTVGWPLPGTAIRIAHDGEVLVRGGHLFSGYWDAEAGVTRLDTDDGWFATGDLGELDADGYLTITGRKKDLIVTASGKNLAPAPLEDRLRAHPLVSQCLVVGDDRPYVAALLTLDPEGLQHWRMMRKREYVPVTELVRDPLLRADLQRAVDGANELVSRAESIRRFAVLPADFTEEAGYVTPSMKLKRAAIVRDFGHVIDELYAAEG